MYVVYNDFEGEGKENGIIIWRIEKFEEVK